MHNQLIYMILINKKKYIWVLVEVLRAQTHRAVKLRWPGWPFPSLTTWSYGSCIYNYICNQCLSPQTLWVRIPLMRDVLDATLCDKVCQWLATGRWFPPLIKLSRHDITEILLNVALNTILLTLNCDLHYRVYFTKSMFIKTLMQFHFVLRFTYLQCLLLFHLVD
jgi:hypothetical protein